MRGGITRYIEVAGCAGHENEALSEISRNLRWLLGAVGESQIRLRMEKIAGRCVLRVDMARGSLLDAVILAISLSSAGEVYLTPIKSSGTLRGLWKSAAGVPAPNGATRHAKGSGR